MSRLSIKTTLVALFAMITIILIGSSSYALFTMNQMNSTVVLIGENWLTRAVIGGQIKSDYNDLRMAYARQLLMTKPDEMANDKIQFKAAVDAIDQSMASYKAGITTDEEQKHYTEVETAIKAYQTMGTRLTNMRDALKMPQARTFLATDMKDQSDRTKAAIDGLVADIMKNTDQYTSESKAENKLATLVMSGITAFAVLAAIAAAIYALLGISRPITLITRSMTGLAQGNVDCDIPFARRKDEIGAMAAAVEVFRRTAVEKIAAEAEAASTRSQSETERMRTEQTERARNQTMAHAASGLGRGLKALASGDLSVQINEQFAQEFEELRHDFNHAVKQLCQTLSTVAHAADNIDSGSFEIANGADNLSRRTEQQAASLEQTAAALDQITTNVSSSSRRVEEARTVATQANASATSSATVVEDAVNAMSRIEQSSNQISNIIGVIDEIAFQTNLLALNAGVEAARAGDAGKGFAVVAQEVRELAQRSARAAKEIKGLIQTSTTEVASGVKLVSQTGDALNAIGNLVATINTHMDAIATSAREQSLGLAEVNSAVNQMDQTTQQNAAMVEETNAAANTLATEVNSMRQLIGQFNLGQGENTSHAVAMLQQTSRKMAGPVQVAGRVAVHKAAPSTAGNAAVAQEWSEF